MKNSLLKKFVSFSYGSWVGLVIGFLTTLVTTRILNPQDFGKASMFTLALNVFSLFIIFGTDQSFVRFFYEEKEESRGGLLYNCIKIPVILSIITICLVMIFYKEITLYLFEEENFIIALFLAVGILVQVIQKFSDLVIRMNQRGNLFSFMAIALKVINFISLMLFYYFLGRKYEIIIYSTVITAIILTVFSIYFEKDFWSFKNIKKQKLSHTKLEIMTYAYPLVITSLINWLFNSFDKMAIKQWSSFEELGLYAAAFKIVALLTVVQTTFSVFWTPVCYEQFEKDPENKEFYQKTSKIITITMLILAIVSIAGKDLIVLLLGANYSEAANIMPFLIFMPVMYTISETTVIGINFYKKPKWHIFIAGASCIINIIGNLLLVPTYGAKGAAISTAFSYIIFFMLRTHIGLIYYKVNYGLKKLYTMLVIIFIYAIFATFKANIFLNIMLGFIVIAIMMLIYHSELRNIYDEYLKDIIKKLFKLEYK